MAGEALPPLQFGLLLLWAPPAYMVLAFLSLLQFKFFYTAFTNICLTRLRFPVWRGTVQPVLKRLLSHMEVAFGPASKFSPGLTHVLLVAVMMVLLTLGQQLASRRR